MANSGLRKQTRADPVKISVMRDLHPLVGAIYSFGKIGSGKTVSLLTFAQMYHDHPSFKYKIFDIWGGDRNEHLYWTLPSNKINYWKNAEKLLRLDSSGPKQYKVNLLYPVTKKLRKKLPSNPPFVKSKVFTINYKDVQLQDMSLIMGSPANRDETTWKDVIGSLKKGAKTPELLEAFKKKKAQNYTVFKSCVHPLVKEGLLQDEFCDLNIDIYKEIADQEAISVLCLDFVDKEYRLFVAGYIIRKIAESLDRRHKKTILLFREASEIFRVSDASIAPDRIKVFKSYLSQWIRMGRRGMHFCVGENTKIKLKGGHIKKIKDFNKVETVCSYNFDKKIIENKKAKCFYTGEKDCYEIELETGEKVIATKDHKFFDENGKEIELKDLKKGDKLLKC